MLFNINKNTFNRLLLTSVSLILALSIILGTNAIDVYATETTQTEQNPVSDTSSETTISSDGADTTTSAQGSLAQGIISMDQARTDLLNELPADIPSVNGKAYILYDATSDTTLLGSEIDTALEPASTTKTMTVLLALENLDMDTIITVTPDMYESIPGDYVKLGITEGEEFTVKDLVYASLLKSANDACLALGIYMGGSIDEFCNMMNDRAEELGCTNTHFTTPYGFADPQNLTSAHDLALILEACVSHSEFTEISTTSQYTVNPTNKFSDSRLVTNANRFICTQEYSYEYYIGGKTGYTDTAGHTIVAAAQKDGRILIGVILGATSSETRYSDLINLFDYGFANYTTVALDSKDYSVYLNTTLDQINESLVDTNLKIGNSELVLEGYHTTLSSRIQAGYTEMVDLSAVQIDPQIDEQSFSIPVLRQYTDGKTYEVGEINIDIVAKDKVIEITPKKVGLITIVKRVLITIAVLSGLVLILAIALLIFRRRYRIRRDKAHSKNTKIL